MNETIWVNKHTEEEIHEMQERKKERLRSWREKNKERRKEVQHLWYEKNKERVKKAKDLWRKNNPDKFKAQKQRAHISRKARGKVTSSIQIDYGVIKYYHLKAAMKRLGLRVTWKRDSFIAWFTHQEKKCYYCGAPLAIRARARLTSLSLDRLDPNKGYEEGNVVLACLRCNVIKGNWFTSKQMKEIAVNYLVDRPSDQGV